MQMFDDLQFPDVRFTLPGVHNIHGHVVLHHCPVAFSGSVEEDNLETQ